MWHRAHWGSRIATLALLVAVLASSPLAGASFPGQNGKLAWDRTGRVLLKAKPRLASPEAQLRDDGAATRDSQAAFSPDGSRAAFIRLGDGGVDVYVTAADGSGAARRLTDDTVVDRHPVWSADGNRIAFEHGTEIWAMNADGSGKVELTARRAGDSPAYDPAQPSLMPAWSPPLRRAPKGRIAFVHQGLLWTMSADGRGKAPLPHACATSNGFCDRIEANPEWSPSGARIAYDYAGDIYIIRLSGAGVSTTLPLAGTANGQFVGGQLDPAWSPDGSLIAFESSQPASDYEIAVARAAGTDTAPRAITDNVGNDANPDWQARATPPKLGKTVNVAVVNGKVRVDPPGDGGFVPLEQARQLPVGSQLDTRRGTVRLTSARDRRGHTQTGQFVGGIFKVLQKPRSDGLTELRLRGGDFRPCASPRRGSSAARSGKRVIRKLGARARRGRFRTRGRYSASAVRGTVWTTIDRCDGTLTRVTRGSVVVRDLPRHRTVIVRAGDSYLARAPGT